MKSIPSNIMIRTELQPGDWGAIARLHGILYGLEYGFDHTFEGYVAAGIADLALNYDPQKDRVWIVEKEGQMIGSLAIVSRSKEEAQLRWFLVHPHSRGMGLGRALLHRALLFCQERRYEHIFLWTIHDLFIATHLHRCFGFKKTDEKIHPLWGKMIHEERYDLHFGAVPEGREGL